MSCVKAIGVMAGVAVVLALAGCGKDDFTSQRPKPSVQKLDRQKSENQSAELVLPAEPPQGGYSDPSRGADQEELFRQIGIELSRRKEVGPVRCMLKAVEGSNAGHRPELEVTLTNTSDQAVTLGILQILLDLVTFIFRAPDDSVVSSFCTLPTHSTLQSRPPVILKPGESKTGIITLSEATGRGFQPLQPGLYSLEAVFHDQLFYGPPIPEQTMLARSNRMVIRVGKKTEKP